MVVLSVIKCLGGVGLFLYGMALMGSMLEKIAGSGLAGILEKLTTSKRRGVGTLKGWGLGLGVTGIIQSSSATTLILIGFVNAGIMNLVQAIPVVYGANIGSTVTAQILRLGDLGAGGAFLKFLKPSAFAPMLISIGAFMYFLLKKQKLRDLGCIFIGLGVLFYGMTIMEEVFSPLKESPSFQELFTSFSNPVLGILTGLALTAVIQSSSASVGILQALSATGTITYGIAIPIIIGQNVGKCMPIILGMVGADKKAKRVSLSYVFFNIIGAVIFSAVIYGTAYTVGLPILEKTVNRGNIANFHLLFNLATSLLLLPFCGLMEKLTGVFVREKAAEEDEGAAQIRKLEDIFLATPGLAMRQCTRLIQIMGEKIEENYMLANSLFEKYDQEVFDKLLKNEAFIDRCETALSAYVVRIDRKRLTPDNKREVLKILNSISDFERMGDYCMRIAWEARNMHESEIRFSERGQKEVAAISGACEHIMHKVLSAFINDDISDAVKIEPMADIVKEMEQVIRSRHVERLREGDCGVEGGVILYGLVSAYERFAGHAANISLHVVQRVRGEKDFDEMHGHAEDREEYRALLTYYTDRFLVPILRISNTSDEPEEDASQDASADGGVNASAEGASEAVSAKETKAKEAKENTEKAEKDKEEKEQAAKEKSEKAKAEKEKAKQEKEKKAKDKAAAEKSGKDKSGKDKSGKAKDVKDKDKSGKGKSEKEKKPEKKEEKKEEKKKKDKDKKD